MSTKQTNPRLDRLWQFDRGMLRSAFVSLFWSVIQERRRRVGFALQSLADALGINKSAVSRWFSGPTQPNWTIDTIADLAHALDLDLEVRATDRQTGQVFTSSGVMPIRVIAAREQPPVLFTPKDPRPQNPPRTPMFSFDPVGVSPGAIN
jgi:transcriptional regulator with XRE-family HTH domain